ncbi:MAG: hypothetical protein K2H01_10440 [Ruminococcus sp.]|nr:hypothetical protein [Ruminococcus sp.]
MKPLTFKPPRKTACLGFLIASVAFAGIIGCSTAGQLNVSAVTYQSINTRKPQLTKDAIIPSDAKILATYAINQNGRIGVIIKNLTDEILTIDQEKSFFINTTEESKSYFDPNVYSSSQTDYSFGTSGTSINLGSVSSALGIGGRLGNLLGGIGVNNSSTTGVSVANTITITDQRQVNIGPRGTIALSKVFPVSGVGKNNVSQTFTMASSTYKESPLRFSICLSYSFNGGNTFEKLVTDFYVSANIYSPVEYKGKVNDALRKIISQKSDLLAQPWYMIYFNNNIKEVVGDDFWIMQSNTKEKTYDCILEGILYDYQ